MNKLNEILKIADIHVSRIEMARSDLKDIFPIDKERIENLNKEQLLLLELLTSRFARLHDLVGKKIIDEFLMLKGEFIENDTMIDKINKIERISIISNATDWKSMREARNHISHEYPDQPEITARHLNTLFDLTPELLAIISRIKARM